MQRHLQPIATLISFVLGVASDTPGSAQNQEVPAAIQAKLDRGIEPFEDPEDRHHVFVRLEDQLFPTTKSFLAFCKKHDKASRSDLRKRVISSLKQKSDASWKSVEGMSPVSIRPSDLDPPRPDQLPSRSRYQVMSASAWPCMLSLDLLSVLRCAGRIRSVSES